MRSMPTPHRGWTIAYFAAWVVALLPVGALAGQVLLKFRDQQDGTDAWWVLGGLAGAALGAVLAHATRAAAPMHRALRVAAPVATVGCVVVAVCLFVAAAQVRGSGMFAGLGEFLLGLLASLAALCSAALWFAGISGPRGER